MPKIEKEFKIDAQKIILCGHSLGGYFVLYYVLKSSEENSFHVTNFVSASPSFHYNHRYLFLMEDSVSAIRNAIPAKLYISMGSKDMADKDSKGILSAFQEQMTAHHYAGLKVQADEFSNFGHLDAALPGFSKGISFIFAK